MIQKPIGLLWLCFQTFFTFWAYGQATTSLIKEPGIGTPDGKEVFVAVGTDGYLANAKEKAMEQVRFQARHKGMTYEISKTSDEDSGSGFRAIVEYRLKPLIVEAPPAELTWWQSLIEKIRNGYSFVRRSWGHAITLIKSYLPQDPAQKGNLGS
jgi:hypothetical protein